MNSHCRLPYHLLRPAIKERESKREKETLSPSSLSFFSVCSPIVMKDFFDVFLWRPLPGRARRVLPNLGIDQTALPNGAKVFLFLPLLRGVNSSRLDGFFCVRLIFSCHQKALIFLEMQFPSSTTFEGLAFRGARPCQFCVHFLRPANCA